MAQRRARIDGGEPTVTIYEIPDNLIELSDLKCRVFEDNPTIEWAIFIRNNRDRNFSDYESAECNLDCKYDVVVGPVREGIEIFEEGRCDA